MRVIAGEFRSRKLKSVPGLDTRPTPDRLRETLFDILAPTIEGARFLDAYAGTGAVGIEALSRGAGEAVFIERSRAALAVLQENLGALDLNGRSRVLLGSALQHMKAYAARAIVFVDPPYALDREYTAALELLGEASPALVVVQHDKRRLLQQTYSTLEKTRQVIQGDNALTFYTKVEEEPDEPPSEG